MDEHSITRGDIESAIAAGRLERSRAAWAAIEWIGAGVQSAMDRLARPVGAIAEAKPGAKPTARA